MLVKSLLGEFLQEAENTRKLLNAIPNSALGFYTLSALLDYGPIGIAHCRNLRLVSRNFSRQRI
jgi:hypothetical protein